MFHALLVALVYWNLAFAAPTVEPIPMSPKRITFTKDTGETFYVTLSPIYPWRFENRAKDSTRKYGRCNLDFAQHPAYSPFDDEGKVSVPEMNYMGKTWEMSSDAAAGSGFNYVKQYYLFNDVYYQGNSYCQNFKLPTKDRTQSEDLPFRYRVTFLGADSVVSLAWSTFGEDALLMSVYGLTLIPVATGTIDSWYYFPQ